MDGWQFRAEQLRLPDGHLTAIPVLLLTGEDPSYDQIVTLKAVGHQEAIRRRRTSDRHPDRVAAGSWTVPFRGRQTGRLTLCLPIRVRISAALCLA